MIRLAHPVFTKADWERLWPLLESGMLVQGATVAAFEASCATRLGVERAVAVSSGTAALHLALLVAGACAGREVVVPAFGWPSAANVAEHLGATVRFVDIEPETYALDPVRAGGVVDTSRERGGGAVTAALVPIHPFGQALHAPAWAALRDEVAVVEDAACAFGAADAGGHVAGTWGRLGIVSLHARKGLTTGEGGLVVARDPADLDRIARLRNLGLEVTGGVRQVVEPGLNYRLTEVAAALGLGQLERYDAAVQRRRALAERYRRRLSTLPEVRVPGGLADPGHALQSFIVTVADGVDRDALIAGLAERGVQSTVGTIAAHLQPYYAERYSLAPDDFPVARWAHHKTLALPMHERLGDEDVDKVVAALEEVLEG